LEDALRIPINRRQNSQSYGTTNPTKIFAWPFDEVRRHYNGVRPHSALGYRPTAPETIVFPVVGLPSPWNSLETPGGFLHKDTGGPIMGGWSAPRRNQHSLTTRKRGTHEETFRWPWSLSGVLPVGWPCTRRGTFPRGVRQEVRGHRQLHCRHLPKAWRHSNVRQRRPSGEGDAMPRMSHRQEA